MYQYIRDWRNPRISKVLAFIINRDGSWRWKSTRLLPTAVADRIPRLIEGIY